MHRNRFHIAPLFALHGRLLAGVGVVGLLTMTACGGATEETRTNTGSAYAGETSPAADQQVDLTPETTNANAEPCSLRTVLFHFDSAELTAGARNNIQQAVGCYQDQGVPARLHLTGATDPRGTEEYNIALGERRARAVAEYITSLGIDPSRVGFTSMGEETATGSDEAGWAQDRSVSATEQNAAP